MSNGFRLKRRVQFYETDSAGIVHFSWFYRYMEEAEHALWRAAGLSIAMPDADVGFPRVAATFDFRRPLRFEDEFEVHIRIVKFGEKSIRYAASVTKDGVEIATGSLTIACVRRQTGRPLAAVAIPPDIVRSLRAANDAGAGTDAA